MENHLRFSYRYREIACLFKTGHKVTRFGKLSLRKSSTWQTYFHILFNKSWFNQIEIRVKLTQETAYHELFSETFKQ